MKLDCYNKTFECLDEELNLKVVKGIPKVICVRHISTMQLKNFCRRGCRLYATHVLEATENETSLVGGLSCVTGIHGCFS